MSLAAWKHQLEIFVEAEAHLAGQTVLYIYS